MGIVLPSCKSGRRGSNSRPLAWKANALSTELLPQKQTASEQLIIVLIRRLQPRSVSSSGKRWIRTTEGVRQQIYSLPHLATLVSSQLFNSWTPSRVREPMEGFEPTTPRLQITCSGQLSYIGISTVTGCKGRDIFYICKFFSSFFFKPSEILCKSHPPRSFKEL